MEPKVLGLQGTTFVATLCVQQRTCSRRAAMWLFVVVVTVVFAMHLAPERHGSSVSIYGLEAHTDSP
jgi:hypothetical protein